MLLRPRYLPVHMLKAHISVIYKIALLYFVVTAHELSAPEMLMNFSGFHSCLEIHFCPQACPLPPPPHPCLSLVRTSHCQASSPACSPLGHILNSCELAAVSSWPCCAISGAVNCHRETGRSLLKG